MEMKNDNYLWDGSDPPDENVQRLERLLAPLRSERPPLRMPESAPRSHRRTLLPYAAAAISLLAAGAGTVVWRTRAPRPATWAVASIAGTPRIGAAAAATLGRLAVGQTLTTDATSEAQIDIRSVGRVNVDGNTRVRLVETGAGRHRLALDRGTLHAFITAAPGQFVVNTPSATATDLGCVYTLQVDDDGRLLSVAGGWVVSTHRARIVCAGRRVLPHRCARRPAHRDSTTRTEFPTA